eukprot:TRINITY_DN12762_c0_g1_i1.p1 TRINITY_DN12762_c0_g1~~TRINITY_DN12762_c0_g1_i1.p1  ORF type:complete len:286 (+),score=47.47 TRINITY_DN12762_c0_g1_i1:55-912(+)
MTSLFLSRLGAVFGSALRQQRAVQMSCVHVTGAATRTVTTLHAPVTRRDVDGGGCGVHANASPFFRPVSVARTSYMCETGRGGVGNGRRWYKITAAEIKRGTILERNDKLWEVVSVEHQKKGRGSAHLQSELREVLTGIKVYDRFRPAETLQAVDLHKIRCEFVDFEASVDGGEEMAVFENVETEEDIELKKKSLPSPQVHYLQEGMNVDVVMHEESMTLVNIRLPISVPAIVVQTEPFIKGQQEKPSYKPALLDNGRTIKVPPYITNGEKITVKMPSEDYEKRS